MYTGSGSSGSCWEEDDDDDCSSEYLLGEDDTRLGVLRQFRDEVLVETPLGQEIIILYYQWSPIIVKAMKEDEEFKEDVKEMIDGILPLIEGTVE